MFESMGFRRLVALVPALAAAHAVAQKVAPQTRDSSFTKGGFAPIPRYPGADAGGMKDVATSHDGDAFGGIVVAVAGVVLASGPELPGRGSGGGRPLVLAMIAALSFGLVYVFIDRGSAHSVTMTLLAQRATSVLVVSLIAAAWMLRRARAGLPGTVGAQGGSGPEA